jgi:hypothetical protein
LNHEVRIERADTSNNSIGVFAAVAGHSKLLLRFYDLGVDFTTAPQIAALFHKNDVYDWLLTVVDRQRFLEKNRPLVWHKAAISNNLTICQRLLEEGVKFNEIDVLVILRKFAVSFQWRFF